MGGFRKSHRNHGPGTRSSEIVAKRSSGVALSRIAARIRLLALASAPLFALLDNSAVGKELPPAPQAAIDRGLKYLDREAFRWKESRGCAACHHADTMIWTFNEARAAGYSVDEKALGDITEWAFLDMKTNSLTEQPAPRNVVNLGWVYLLLSMETVPSFNAQPATDAVRKSSTPAGMNADVVRSAKETLLRQIVAKQASDGSWGVPLDLRVPLGGPAEDITILSRLALLESGEKSKGVSECMEKAAGWLTSNQDAQSRQASNFRLLMDVIEGQPTAQLKPRIARIRAQQNADGGWSQTADLPSDAYATGQTLYVLTRADVRPDSAEIQRGARFLTANQKEDGSWPMVSRVHAKNLGPITGAGTGWAVLGLIRATAKAEPSRSE